MNLRNVLRKLKTFFPSLFCLNQKYISLPTPWGGKAWKLLKSSSVTLKGISVSLRPLKGSVPLFLTETLLSVNTHRFGTGLPGDPSIGLCMTCDISDLWRKDRNVHVHINAWITYIICAFYKYGSIPVSSLTLIPVPSRTELAWISQSWSPWGFKA